MVTAVATTRVPEAHRRDRRIVRRRQLLDVRPRLLAAVPLDLAGEPHLGHGRPAGGVGARRPSSATSSRRAARSGRAEAQAEFEAPIRAQYEEQGSPYYATARLWDDGVIDPPDTRDLLGLALDVVARTPLPEPRFGVFRM